MKKLGLLGGTSWHSSLDYYRLINQFVNRHQGGVASADLVLRSVDFSIHHQHQLDGAWDKIAQAFSDDAIAMKAMGVEGLLICANTMYIVADQVAKASGLPVLHIADAIKQTCDKTNTSVVGVLGTIFTMEHGFYQSALEQRGIQALVPQADDRQEINRIIFDELVKGEIKESSRDYYLQQVQQLKQAGAESVVMGCTEIGLLIDQSMTAVPLIDSLTCHAEYGAAWCLSSVDAESVS